MKVKSIVKKNISRIMFYSLLVLQISTVFGSTINYSLKMKVDNVYFAPKENDGSDIRPILYENSIYLPVRALSDVIGAYIKLEDNILSITSGEKKDIADEKTSYMKKTEKIDTNINNNLKVYVNGNQIECKVITYKGRSYLPLRILANALNIKIDYDKKMEMILIGESSIVESDYDIISYSITNEEIKSKLGKLRKKFPNNTYWNTIGIEESIVTSDTITNKICDHNQEFQISGMAPMGPYCNGYSGATGGGIQCYGFASKISDEIFGIEAPIFEHSSYESAKIGDNVRVNGHSMIIIEKNKDYVKVVECNSGQPCRINWDRKVYKNSLNKAKYITRY